MSNKVERLRKEYKLTEDDINYVAEVAKKNNIQPSDALSKIINEQRNISQILDTTLKKILLGVNNINKLSEIQLEIINSICLKENYKEDDFISTNEFTSDWIAKASEKVTKKIAGTNITKATK